MRRGREGKEPPARKAIDTARPADYVPAPRRNGRRPLANHKSALKRIRQTERRRERNRHVRNGMRTVVKQFRAAVEAEDRDGAVAQFVLVERTIRKAASKGIIPQRRADRSISRLAKRLSAFTASA
jgi:small subunit ribosomal protein S20